MESLAIATVAFVIAGIVKGVVGFGFPIIALVILTLVFGLLDALAIIIIPTLATNISQALAGSWLPQIFRRMWLYFLLATIFIFLTSFYIGDANVDLLTGLLGAVLLVFAVTRLFNLHVFVHPKHEAALSVVLGAVNGTLTGFTGSFMVPSVLYMQALGFGRDMLVQAMGVFFTVSMLMLTISLGRNDLISADQLKLSAIALVPSFAGVYAGRWVRHQIDEAVFQKVFLVAVLILGFYITMRSLLTIQNHPLA